MTTPIAPIQIQIPLPVMFPTVNCYLVPGEALTLIDCGVQSPENWSFFQQELQKHGYQVQDIEQIIITHEHGDHIGLLPEIMANCAATVHAPKAIEGWFVHPEKLCKEEIRFTQDFVTTLGLPETALAQAKGFWGARKIPRPIQALDRIQYFEEGEQLDFGKTSWEVLNTPGHCPTQHVFIQKNQRRIFGSDMLLPITPMPIIVEKEELSEPEKGPLLAMLDSYERLRSYDFQDIYPGHGPVFSQANVVIDRQLARIDMRKEECLAAIKSGLSTPFEIKQKMYPHQQTPPNFSGLYMVLGYIQLLEKEGRVEKIEEQGPLRLRYIQNH